MKNYMLFIHEDLEALKQMSEDELQEDIRIMVKWVEELSRSGNYVQGDPLEADVKIVRRDEIISDGPFIETKEAVSGYLIIKAENFDQAVQFAQSCPLLGRNVTRLDVRPIMKY